MKVRYLLDTHTLVFFVLTPHKLGPKARKVFAQALLGELAITPTTVAELGQLIHEDKIEFEGKPGDVFGPVLASLVQVPLSLSAALKAPALRLPHGDPSHQRRKHHRLRHRAGDLVARRPRLAPKPNWRAAQSTKLGPPPLAWLPFGLASVHGCHVTAR